MTQYKDLIASLHNHSTYSMLDGASSPTEHVQYAIQRGFEYLAITDHGHISGFMELARACENTSLQPIFGCEFYVNLMPDLDSYGHLTVLAKNDEGYRNLLTLYHKSWDNLSKAKFGKKKNQITWDLLEEYNEGLFIGSGCLVGTIARCLLKDREDLAIKNLDHLIAIFGKHRMFAEFVPQLVTHNYDYKTQKFEKNECFLYSTKVLSMQGWIPIGKIVEKFKKGEKIQVLSYNERLKIFQYKDVTSVQIKDPQDELIKLIFTNNTIISTKKHRFLTVDGWKRADEICVYDRILGFSNGKLRGSVERLSYDQEQILIGSYLGDGSVTISRDNFKYSLRVSHGENQKKYAYWKSTMFKDCSFFKRKQSDKSFGIGNYYGFCSKRMFNSLGFTCPKRINKNIIKKIDWQALAIWYMDDGCLRKVRYKNSFYYSGILCTHSFTKEENLLLLEKLHLMGVKCSLYKQKNFYYIKLNSRGFLDFCNQLFPYIHEDLRYKLHPDVCKQEKYGWKISSDEAREFLVIGIEKIFNNKKLYDIEVKDNHNFIVSYNKHDNKSGLIAHNCTPWAPDGDILKGYQIWLWDHAVVKRHLKPCITLDAHFTTPDKKAIQDALLMNGESGWSFYENYNVLTPDVMFKKLSYLPSHSCALHDSMVENVREFCSGVGYTKKSKQLYLPFKYDSAEESYLDFAKNVDLDKIIKINNISVQG